MSLYRELLYIFSDAVLFKVCYLKMFDEEHVSLSRIRILWQTVQAGMSSNDVETVHGDEKRQPLCFCTPDNFLTQIASLIYIYMRGKIFDYVEISINHSENTPPPRAFPHLAASPSHPGIPMIPSLRTAYLHFAFIAAQTKTLAKSMHVNGLN